MNFIKNNIAIIFVTFFITSSLHSMQNLIDLPNRELARVFVKQLNRTGKTTGSLKSVLLDIHNILCTCHRFRTPLKIALISFFKKQNISMEYVLNYAIHQNCIWLTRLLIECEAQVNMPYAVKISEFTTHYEVPIHIAIEDKNIDMLRFLLTIPEIDVNKQNPLYNDTPLHKAAEKNSPEMVEMLLRHKDVPGHTDVIIDAINDLGNTPLHSTVLCDTSYLLTAENQNKHISIRRIPNINAEIEKIIDNMTTIINQIANRSTKGLFIRNYTAKYSPLDLAEKLNIPSEFLLLSEHMRRVINLLTEKMVSSTAILLTTKIKPNPLFCRPTQTTN